MTPMANMSMNIGDQSRHEIGVVQQQVPEVDTKQNLHRELEDGVAKGLANSHIATEDEQYCHDSISNIQEGISDPPTATVVNGGMEGFHPNLGSSQQPVPGITGAHIQNERISKAFGQLNRLLEIVKKSSYQMARALDASDQKNRALWNATREQSNYLSSMNLQMELLQSQNDTLVSEVSSAHDHIQSLQGEKHRLEIMQTTACAHISGTEGEIEHLLNNMQVDRDEIQRLRKELKYLSLSLQEYSSLFKDARLRLLDRHILLRAYRDDAFRARRYNTTPVHDNCEHDDSDTNQKLLESSDCQPCEVGASPEETLQHQNTLDTQFLHVRNNDLAAMERYLSPTSSTSILVGSIVDEASLLLTSHLEQSRRNFRDTSASLTVASVNVDQE